MPPKAAKVAEKVVPKDEAQVVYVNIKLTAPAPPAPAPAAPSAQPTTSSPAPAVTESPSKGNLKSPKAAKPAESAPVAAPVAPVTSADEMQEVRFEIIANVLCRTDIFIDYVRRQSVKLIQEKLAAEDPENKIGEALRTKLKDLQVELTGKPITELVLRDGNGTDIDFNEVWAECFA
jgi:ABC-type uncharacterized transport system involved in gliding motility auxiliary subunit